MDPDLPLIEALQDGDGSALNELIERHREALHRFVYRYLRNEAAAEDAVQETFVRVYFKAKKFRPKSSVKTWVYAIALNLCRDQFRRLARHRGDVSMDAAPADAARTEIADRAPLPSVHAVESDRFAALQQAVDALPERLREAIILFSLEQRSQIEVAELLGITPKAVETRVYHAKARLRSALSLPDASGELPL